MAHPPTSSSSTRTRTLRICTWNTFLAPTMWNRFARLFRSGDGPEKNTAPADPATDKPAASSSSLSSVPDLCGFWHGLHHLDDNLGIDLLVLQETNSLRAGPTTLLLHLLLRRLGVGPGHPTLMQLLDYAMIFESSWWGWNASPWRMDIRPEIEAYARAHTSFQYVLCSGHSIEPIDPGLMILSRLPMGTEEVNSAVWETPLPRDATNRPGVLAINIRIPAKEDEEEVPQAAPHPDSLSKATPTSASPSPFLLRMYTLHLVPTLPNTSFPYRATNFCNWLLRQSPPKIRLHHAHLLRQEWERQRANALQRGHRIGAVWAGDFNILDNSREFRSALSTLQAINCTLVPTPGVDLDSFGPGGGVNTIEDPPRQIDFIVVEEKLAEETASKQEELLAALPAETRSLLPSSSSLFSRRVDTFFGSDHFAIWADIVVPV